MSLKPSESTDIENMCGQKYEEGHIKDRGCTHIFSWRLQQLIIYKDVRTQP